MGDKICLVNIIFKQKILVLTTHIFIYLFLNLSPKNNLNYTAVIILWGQYDQPSLSGTHYLLSIFYDFCRSIWAFLMKFKSRTHNYMTIFYNFVETQFGTKIHVICCNNDIKFLSLNDFLAAYGIDHICFALLLFNKMVKWNASIVKYLSSPSIMFFCLFAFKILGGTHFN